MTKQSSAPSLHKIGWKQFDHDTGLLLDYLQPRLKAHNTEIRAIVAVTRGGLFPGGLVAYALNIPWVDTICIKSYRGTQQGTIRLLKDIHPDTVARGGEGGEYLLFVDDLADEGGTIRFIRERYPRATVITPYVKSKPQGINAVDAWAVQIPDTTWYAFVWSKREPKPKALRPKKTQK